MKPHPPFFSAWLTAGLVLIIAASGQVLAGSYFLISKDGETYGYSTLEQFDRENGLLQNHLETRILFSRIGNLPDTHYAANEFYSRQEKRPFTYEVTIDYKTKSKRLTCSFPRLGEAQILGETHGVSRKKVLSIPEKFVIFDNNLFGQFELIFSYLPQEVGDFSIPVFVPQVANMRRFDARFMGNKEIVVMGKKQQAALFYCTLIPLTFKVWIGSEGRLLRLEIPAMGVTVERVKRGYIRAFEACHHSNMMQADLKGPLVVPELLESAAVSLKLAAEKLPFSKRKLTGTRQRFTGSLNEENLEGTFYLGRRLPTEKSGSIPSPQEFALAGHLAPSINQESDLPQIKTMALDIAGETTGREELACRIAGWVADNIQFKPGPLQAIKTLQRKQGPVAGFANLTVALLKASGIPSRTVQGLAYFPYGSGRFTWHIWVEFFGTDNTWHSLDPFMDESRSTDNLHIVLPPITNISGLTAEITIISPVPPEEILLALPERDFSVPDQTTSYFALQVGKQQFGYLHTDFQQSSDSRESGQSQYLSHLFMDANELGYDTMTQKNISIILDRNGKQLAYRCAARYLSKIGVIDDLFDCKVYPGYIEHITYEAPADRKSSITSIEDLVPVKKRIPFSSQPFLFGQDMIDQWTLLTRHTNIEELTWAEVPVYIPEQKKIMILDIFGGDTENVEDVVCKRIEIPFLDIKLWVSFKGDLMKAEISSQRTQIVRSGPEVLQLKADEDSLDWSIRGKGVPLPE